MQPLLMCVFLALTAAKPRQVTLDQWADGTPSPKGEEPQNMMPLINERDAFENRNPDFTDDGLELFEGDMVLTEEQRDGRQAASNVWTSPVSFAISSSSEGDRAAILAGIQHWRDNTCIQFNEVAEGSSVPHIKVIKSTGCWSYVGKTSFASSGGQELSIGSGCTSLGTVVHEFGHAMGLQHTQTRPDRDTYVNILFENILAGKEYNFEKELATTNYSVPYDLTSVMHYSRKAFTKNGQDTIQVKDSRWSGLIGTGNVLSHRDKNIVNTMYNCAAGCSNPPTCQNDGFVSKNCACVCSGNTSGANCQTLTGHYYGSGGVGSC